MAETRSYVPPAGNHWGLPLYDPFAWLLGADTARAALVDQAALEPGHRVLDVGCGTGTLAVLIGTRYPGLEIVGIDPDERALTRARRKVASAGVKVQLDQGFADGLPYPDATFDRVFSTFMLHHLQPEEKASTLREIRRVLRPGGSLHLLDFGGPTHGHLAFIAGLFHASERLHDQVGDGVLRRLHEAGFAQATEVQHRSTWTGPMAWYRAPLTPTLSQRERE